MGKNKCNPEPLGILPGVSDFCILTPEKVVFLEIKTDKKSLSKKQRKFLVKVNRFGQLGLVAHGWSDILDKISIILEKRSDGTAKAQDYDWLPGKVLWVDQTGKTSKHRGPGRVSVFLY